MSDTPRTDAAQWDSYVDVDVSRTLERELNAACAEVERLRAELARLTTLRPASEHDSREHGTVRWLYRTSLGWTNCGTWQARPVAYATHWTPLPDVKEPK